MYKADAANYNIARKYSRKMEGIIFPNWDSEIEAAYTVGANYVYKEAFEIIQNLLSVCNENNLPVVELYGSPSIIQDAKAFLAEGIEDACKRIDSRC